MQWSLHFARVKYLVLSQIRHCEERSDDAISLTNEKRILVYVLAEAQSTQRLAWNRTRMKRMTRMVTDFMVPPFSALTYPVDQVNPVESFFDWITGLAGLVCDHSGGRKTQ